MTSSSSASPLFEPIEHLPEMDDQRASMLRRLGIRRVIDLVFFFPRGYEQPAELVPPSQFVDKQRVSVVGQVKEVSQRVTRSGKHLVGVQVIPDGGGSVRLLWFNQPFRRRMFQPGDRVLATGILRSTGLNWEMVQPQTTPVEDDLVPHTDHPLAIYPLTEGVKQTAVRSMMRQFLPPLLSRIDEVLPDPLRQRLEVPTIRQALQDIHFPSSLEVTQAARRRFKLQELLVLQLALTMQRVQREQTSTAAVCQSTGKIHARILRRLQYEPTADQQAAIEAIRHDMARPIAMNRLLQGDVGSGKTLVAQYAMLLCIANEHQAALMAPTEVLARQHAQTLQRSLERSRVRIGLLTGSLTRKLRRELLGQLAAGEIDLLVGTHSLISEDVLFKRLGLVIVDEQHKFGVLQRARLRSGGLQPHYLILSATPIPRTVAMTAFGDLDVSTIRTKPPGRCPVHSYVATPEKLASWWQFVDRLIGQGRQAYVIAPRVDDNAQDETIATATGTLDELSQGVFAHRRLGLLHGKMPAEAKEAVLDQFVGGQLDLLVATTVVEVGIDVANATVITILDADRLGLSQLHQLRGRVARGQLTGYACAIASAACDQSGAERLKAFQACDDGFELAELDLRMRGPGDLLGTSQTGAPALRLANLVEDGELVELARTVAHEILSRDPQLTDPQLSRLVQQTLRRYGKTLQLGDVG